jgi:opacity protein-like surface antigen
MIVLWPAHAWADWIISAFGGAAHTQPSTIEMNVPSQGTQLTLAGVAYRGESFQSPQYYGLRATWTPDRHRWLGIEGEWIHAKVYATVDRSVRARGTLRGLPIDATIPLSSVVSRISMSHGLNFILINLSVRHGFGPTDATGAHRLTGIVRAGAGPTLPHAESQIDDVYVEQYEGGGLGVQVGGGLEFSLWRGLGALGEYKFTWASPDIDVAGGQATIPARTHHFAFGVQYRF